MWFFSPLSPSLFLRMEVSIRPLASRSRHVYIVQPAHLPTGTPLKKEAEDVLFVLVALMFHSNCRTGYSDIGHVLLGYI